MGTAAIIVLIVVLAAVAVAAWWIFTRRRSQTLRSQFGPEYERTVREYGSEGKAEEALRERQKRRGNIHIRSLSEEERGRFADRWRRVQTRFVDDPSASIREADTLVTEVMVARGYPMAEFDHRAEDLSVDHPVVVQNYRAAHAIAMRQERGEASTEDLRQALVYERELFDELLGAQTVAPQGRKA